MRRTDGANAVELSPGNLGFRDRNTAAGVPGTEVTAQFLNDVQEELLAPIEAVGLAPDEDRGQLLKAIRALIAPYAADAGTQNALVVNVNRPGFSLVAGTAIRTKILNSTIDTATINLRNGAADLGTFALVRPDGSALCPYDLVAGQMAELIYDGANVQIPRVAGRTGDMAFRLAGTSLAAHVPLNGLTIGPAGSGATGRAHPDCRQLYTYLYETFPDSIYPVVTGRGLNAAADWAAGKPITTPNTMCRVPIGVDGMGGAALSGLLAGVPFAVGDAATPGALGGAALHALLAGELPPHPHNYSASGDTGDDTPDHTHPYSPSNSGNLLGGSGPGAVNSGLSGGNTGGASNRHHHPFTAAGATDNGPGASTPHNNMPPFIAVVMFGRL